MFSNEILRLVIVAMWVLWMLTVVLCLYQVRAAWRRGFKRGFALGQSHELDAMLKLYTETYQDSRIETLAESYDLRSFVTHLRRLEHRK